MSAASWSLVLGVLLITMVLLGTLLARLQLSTAMIYLALGYLLGPGGVGVITADPIRHAGILEGAAEVAVLISLFAVGLKLGVPLRERRWILPLRLAFPSMAITVGLVAVVGVWGLGLSLGEAVLLGAILAPTDPVLASGILADSEARPDPVRFSLAAEGALNDGSAFPFVLLGLGLMGLYPLGAGGWHWWFVDLFWATAAGLAIGAILGAAIGKLVVHLRTRHHSALGLDEFLSLGLIAISYGTARLCLASGFLAVLAAGLALRRVRERPLAGTASLDTGPIAAEAGPGDRTTHSHHASASMTRAVRGFNEQLERLAELTIVLIVGAMLPSVTPAANLWWFVPLLFLVLRPLSVMVGMLGDSAHGRQKVMISWFGIRGIGSVFYLAFALQHGVSGALAQDLVSFTLVTIAASIVGHGVSVLPVMRWYARGNT